jgi:hypothetical protein
VKYFLVTFGILDGEHEHLGAVIFEAETAAAAYAMADAEEYDPETDSDTHYFSFAGDGMTGCEFRACQEISREQVAFLERVGLAFRK